MPDLTEPELNKIERCIRMLLKLLPSEYGDPVTLSEERVSVTKSILAKKYVEHVNLNVLLKTGVILLVYDWLFFTPSQVYGLILGAFGSIALALPNIYTPEILAEDSLNSQRTIMSEIESKAELSVKTNVGVAGLAVGFVWQIFAISGPLPAELIPQNHLQGIIQSWLGFTTILILGLLILGVGFSIIRE